MDWLLGFIRKFVLIFCSGNNILIMQENVFIFRKSMLIFRGDTFKCCRSGSGETEKERKRERM